MCDVSEMDMCEREEFIQYWVDTKDEMRHLLREVKSAERLPKLLSVMREMNLIPSNSRDE